MTSSKVVMAGRGSYILSLAFIWGFIWGWGIHCVSPAALSTNNVGPINIGAFNIQVFGVTKMKDPVTVGRIIKILSRCDLVLVQEVKDKSESAIYDLKKQLNDANVNDPFELSLSKRLGTTSQQEQYAFFYRKSKVELTQTHQWEDNGGVYEREPYVVRFTYHGNETLDFGYISLHSKPFAAPPEIDGLVDVYDGMVALWGIKDFILGGDWNAGCSYVSGKEWEEIRLRHDTRFLWLIDDDIDTMLTSDCPYDRFVIAGDALRKAYVNGSASVYRFDEDMGLTQEEGEAVSDHYPIELKLT